MIDAIKFLPVRKADQLAYAKQIHDVVSATGFDPTTLGLTPTDVTELGTLLTADQANADAINTANAAKKAKTQDMSAPGGTHDQLLAKVRFIANAARVSNASDGVLASIGVSRRAPNPTPKNVPAAPPEFSLANVKPGVINIRYHEEGSAHPRARAATATGVQIAVVNAANPAADNEADNAPILTVSRSPAALDSTKMPANVRLYARWITQRGQTGPWSLPLEASVL
jgi:hypothetical protein